MRKEKQFKPANSDVLALALIRKMVAYEAAIDRKQEKSSAEKRHVEYLRAIRKAGLFE